MDDTSKRSLLLHETYKGKLSVCPKIPVNNRDDLSLIYTPGVAAACLAIARDSDDLYRYTMKANSVAVITDGSAVLGLGNIGADASLPVMEGKCLLFKKFADIDAYPICVKSDTIDEFVDTVKRITTSFGGINLEDIKAPYCFEIEKRLRAELDIPVFHDDQHGTAIVTLAALINAFKVTKRTVKETRVVVSGAGAAGTSIVKLLLEYGIKDIVVCDSKGAIFDGRKDLSNNSYKFELTRITNPKQRMGSLSDVIRNSDVFIGVSAPGIVTKKMISSMAKNAIVFALANPIPEIMPDDAKNAGAYVVGTGRSDFPNQINNVLVFPGIFRGLLDSRTININSKMYLVAAKAISSLVDNPTAEKIIPDIFDDRVSNAVASAIKNA